MTEPDRTGREVTDGELFRLLVENVRDDAIFALDPDGRVVSWNPGAERLLGYVEAEVVGQPCDLFFTPEDRAAGFPRRELEEALATGRVSDDRWHVRKDGSRFFANGTVTPLRDEGGRLRGFARIMRDRTEWTRAGEELARRTQEAERLRRLYEAALSNTPDLVYVFDLGHRFVYANEGLLRMWGRTWDEAAGKNCLELGYEPWHAAMHDREIEQVVATRQPVKGEVPFTGTFGRRVYEYIFVPVVGEGGAVEAVAGTTRDVTDRRRAEEQVRHSEERFRSLMEQAPFSVQVFDATGRTVRVNRAWEELWGVTLDQIADYNVLHDPQLEAKGVLPHIRRAFAGEPSHVPAIQYDPNETVPGRTRHADPVRWVAAVAYPIRDDAGRVREVILVHEDVTERKRAEEALRESEGRFARFMRHLPGLAWVKDAPGRYVYANDAAETAFGTARDQLYGRTDEDVFPPATATQFRENDQRAIESSGVQTFEALEHPDGATHHSLVSKFPIPDSDGRPAFVGGIAIDVTELRRAEDARQFLAEAGAVLSSTLDYEITLSAVARLAVPRLADWCTLHLVDTGGGLRRLAVAHTDPEKVRWADEMAHRYPPDPDDPRGIGAVIRSGESLLVPNVTDEMLVAGARDPDHLVLLRELGLRSVMIVPLVARDRTLGAVTFVAAESSRRYGPDDLALAQELAGRAALAVDNARLFRESEESLRRLGLLVEASARLTSSLELPAVQSAVLDLSHRLVAADAYAVWRLDAAANEWRIAESANLSESYLCDGGHIPATGQQMPNRPIVAEDAQGSAELESRRLAYRAEGIESVLAVPLRVHGLVTGALVFYYRTRHRFDDVTVRVASALADLAGAALGTAELYRREQASRHRAEEADRAKDEFLALLGHELRNPLAPIKNALHLLELKGDDVEVSARARARIDRQVTHLTRLVDELLDASRIARGKVRLTVEPLDLAALVRTTVEDHRDGVEAAGLALEVTVTGPVRVRGDHARLAQVVSNLLTNATKFTPTGGRVIVRVAIDEGEAVLTVSDTGIGIAPADLPNLFQAFRQVDADPARSKGGLGLGLAVVKGLVELHGGQVAAESAGRGAGANFVVRLPMVAPDRDAEPVTRTPERAPVATDRRVVIVEDGADTAESLAELLELQGFRVSIAATGPDGLALCRQERPDAVVCDLGLPGMTGFEVARALRDDPATAGAVLVAVSGYAQEEDRRKAREAGFDALLAKPAAVEDLTRLLCRPKG